MSDEEAQTKSELEEHLEAEEAAEREKAGGDTSHDLAEEDATKIEKPKGSPGLVSVASLTKLYKTRAQFFEHAALIDIDLMAKVANGDIDVNDVAAVLPVMASYTRSIDAAMAALECVARDKQAFRGWAKSAADEDRLSLFFWYFSEMQPGEAQSSPTS